MDTPTGSAEQELESLTQFLYLAPIGLVQASGEGEILLLNPMAAQLLLPLARDRELTNLFDALQAAAPGLREQARSYAPAHGRVCDNVELRVDAASADGPQVLSLTLLKLDEARLMAVIHDVTAAVRREAALRQSRSWITGILSGRGDYALMALGGDGSVRSWNPGVATVTGFQRDQTLGRSVALFDTPQAPPDRVAARLAAARRDGWHLEDGAYRNADGSHYPGSALLVPVDPAQAREDDAIAFNLVLRKSNAADDGSPPDET